MERIILGLITPRAGEWNHRYIIPDGKTWNDTELAKALHLLETSETSSGTRYGIILRTSVRQQGGREGMEKLFFYCEGFDALNSRVQNECYSILDKWFKNQCEAMIQRVNWSVEGQKQTIQRIEMGELYRDLERLTTSVPQSFEEPEKKKNSCCLKGGCLMLAIVLGIVLTTGLFSESLKELGEAIKEGFETIKQQVTGSGRDDQPQENDDSFYDLFEWSDKEQQDRSKLQDVFDDLWKIHMRDDKAHTYDVDGYINKEVIKNLLKNKKTLDPLVLPIDGEDVKTHDWEVLKGIEPQKFHKLIKTIKETGWVFADSNSNPECQLINTEGVDPVFYYSNECEYAEALKNWLGKKAEVSGHETVNLQNVIDEVFKSNEKKGTVKGSISGSLEDKGNVDSDAQQKADDIMESLAAMLAPQNDQE